MPADVKNVLKFFRGKRMIALFAVVGIAVFLVLGGHRKAIGFAVDEMAGFLLGAGDLKDEEMADSGGVKVIAASARPADDGLLPGVSILSHVGPSEAMAAPAIEETPVEEEAPVIEETMLAQATSEPPMEQQAAVKSYDEDEAVARKIEYQYTAGFLRDPFKPLVSGGEGSSNRLLEVSSASMVGSVWGESGIIALLEDDSGRSFALKVGDRVVNGRVVSVTPATVTFTITVFGMTRSVTLELAEEGEW
jgi:hypothetical protein